MLMLYMLINIIRNHNTYTNVHHNDVLMDLSDQLFIAILHKLYNEHYNQWTQALTQSVGPKRG